MNTKKYILIAFFLSVCQVFFSQSQLHRLFNLEVRVVDKDSNMPIKNAEVSVNAFTTNFSDINGVYKVKASVGDELIVTHPDFDMVRHIINSDEEIKILVEGFLGDRGSRYKTVSKRKQDNYFQLIDSAKLYQKKDIEKSISFVAEALKSNQTTKRNANSYKVLADVYFYWKQYDLAINNYKISLQIRKDNSVKLQLAHAEFLAKKYKESEATYKELLSQNLTKYKKVLVLEGLANSQFALNKFNEANISFNKALELAKTKRLTSKITDLNSKLADVSAKQGKENEADSFYQNSLELASKENKKRSVKEQQKVADYYNKSRRYDDEIKLRKESLKDVEESNVTSEKEIVVLEDSITSQKINYKIGNAYVLKEDYPKAITYLEKSKKEAEENNDYVVEKDATRKMSEVFATVGNYTKALKSYQDYVQLVDEDYIRKQQEIQQVKRFSKKISENQNRIASLEKDKELTQSKISLAYVDQKLSEESNRRQRQIIYSLIGGFLLMSLLAYFMYRNNKQQKLANNLLALKSMRSQMNPHFIFNALNSVNSFIAVNDERNANRYLSEFSVLMRSVLENSDEDFIPLSKEIELLELYAKLEHNRFKDKFDYTILVDKNIDIDTYKIPPMLLQPYIENAIWHGLRYKDKKGNLAINIQQKTENSILISIEDNGIGRKRSAELKTKNQLKQKSKGMSTIKNRITILNDMYKDKIDVVVSDVSSDGSGTKVEVILKK